MDDDDGLRVRVRRCAERESDAERVAMRLSKSSPVRGRGRSFGDVVRAALRPPRFLAKLDGGGKIDPDALMEKLAGVKERTQEMVRDLKVPKVEDLKALIEDIRAEQSEAKYHPDKRRLDAVAEFFAYTEEEGALRRRATGEEDVIIERARDAETRRPRSAARRMISARLTIETS